MSPRKKFVNSFLHVESTVTQIGYVCDKTGTFGPVWVNDARDEKGRLTWLGYSIRDDCVHVRSTIDAGFGVLVHQDTCGRECRGCVELVVRVAGAPPVPWDRVFGDVERAYRGESDDDFVAAVEAFKSVRGVVFVDNVKPDHPDSA